MTTEWRYFDEIFCSGRAWHKDQSTRFWWRSRCRVPESGSRSRFGIYLKFFIYCCDFYRQPRIKHDNPRRRFALYRVLSVWFILFSSSTSNTSFQSRYRIPSYLQLQVCVQNVPSAAQSSDIGRPVYCWRKLASMRAYDVTIRVVV